MADYEDDCPPKQGQALVVGFMENDLRTHHKYFENPPVRYDERTARYVDILQPRDVSSTTAPGAPTLLAPTPVKDTMATALAHRPNTKPEESVRNAMTYWNMIFPSAMEKFQNMPGVEPPKRRKPTYDIRSDRTWAEVYEKLENARDHYIDKTGISGGFRRVRRWLADNATAPTQIAIKVVPQMDIVTPVLAAVQIILEAVRKGAEVRKETLDAFDELEDVFSDVELFVGTFHEEGSSSILEKALSLVAHVLVAIERGIGFFTRSDLKRGVEAMIKGKDYEKPLLDSLTTVTSRSKRLMAEALKNHIRDFHQYSRASLHIYKLIQEGQEEIAVAVKEVNIGVREVVKNTDKIINAADAMNAKLVMLMDKYDEAREEIRQQKRFLMEGAQTVRELRHLVVRSISPAPPASTWAPPRRSPGLLPADGTEYIDQEELWQLLDISDIDTADMEGVEEKARQMPRQDRARTEQIVNDHTFQEWIVSPSSTKLLINGNFSALMLETSALSLFCTTLAKAFRSRKRYLCVVWFCGRHLGYDDESDVDSTDSEAVSDDGDDNGELGWGQDEEDDYGPGTRQRVIKRMVRSLIAQLLCDYDFGPGHLLPPDADLDGIEEGHSLAQLRRLFRWLVRQLPRGVTLFCLVDGIVFYEREDFEDPMLDVLGDLLELTVSDDVSATVKVLVTSPRPPSTVRLGFEGEIVDSDGAGETTNSILSIDLLTPSHVDVSEERVLRNLGGSVDETGREHHEELLATI